MTKFEMRLEDGRVLISLTLPEEEIRVENMRINGIGLWDSILPFPIVIRPGQRIVLSAEQPVERAKEQG